MATTSGCCSSARKFFVSLLDGCCDLRTREKILWFLKLKFWPFLLIALVVAAGSVLLLLRFAVAPQIKAYVVDARLNSFVFANKSGSAATTTSFTYNISISVALVLRNTNSAMHIKYTKPLVAAFIFDDRLLYNLTVPDKGQKPLKRKLHLLQTGGEVPYVLDTAAVEEFKKQNATGVFKMEMRLSGEITLGIGNNRGLEMSCPLTLQRPPPGPDPDVVLFHEVDCKPDKPKKIVF